MPKWKNRAKRFVTCYLEMRFNITKWMTVSVAVYLKSKATNFNLKGISRHQLAARNISERMDIWDIFHANLDPQLSCNKRWLAKLRIDRLQYSFNLKHRSIIWHEANSFHNTIGVLQYIMLASKYASLQCKMS